MTNNTEHSNHKKLLPEVQKHISFYNLKYLVVKINNFSIIGINRLFIE